MGPGVACWAPCLSAHHETLSVNQQQPGEVTLAVQLLQQEFIRLLTSWLLLSACLTVSVGVFVPSGNGCRGST